MKHTPHPHKHFKQSVNHATEVTVSEGQAASLTKSLQPGLCGSRWHSPPPTAIPQCTGLLPNAPLRELRGARAPPGRCPARSRSPAAARGADTRQPRHRGGSGQGAPALGLGSPIGGTGGEKQKEAGKAQDGGCGTAMGCARSLDRDEKGPGRGERAGGAALPGPEPTGQRQEQEVRWGTDPRPSPALSDSPHRQSPPEARPRRATPEPMGRRERRTGLGGAEAGGGPQSLERNDRKGQYRNHRGPPGPGRGPPDRLPPFHHHTAFPYELVQGEVRHLVAGPNDETQRARPGHNITLLPPLAPPPKVRQSPPECAMRAGTSHNSRRRPGCSFTYAPQRSRPGSARGSSYAARKGK